MVFHGAKSFLLVTAFSFVVLVGVALQASADTVEFTFTGPCANVSGQGCSAFGASPGSLVSGIATFDSSVIVLGNSFNLPNTSPLYTFELQFGSFEFTKAEVNRNVQGGVIEIFTPPNQRQLELNPFRLGALQSNNVLLNIANIDPTLTDLNGNEATAQGFWLENWRHVSRSRFLKPPQ